MDKKIMKKNSKKNSASSSWIIKTVILVFFVSLGFSLVSQSLLSKTNLMFSIIILLIIVFLGVMSDMVGVAVAKAEAKPFHSMAANKVRSAKYSLLLVKNASQVATFCNDVIGDIAGIISGTAISMIVISIMLLELPIITKTMVSVMMSAIVAALTIGGKALGKEYALKHSKDIVNWVGKFLYKIDKTIGHKFIKF